MQAFSELPHCVLHITGNILSDYEQIRDYASKFKNIIYYERQNYDDYIRLLHSVTYVLSTRDPHAPENMHNFPSKIIEGLLHNRVVISTIQYPQLKGLYLKTVRHDHLKEDIESFVSDENVVLEFYANQSIKVKQLYNPKIWGNVMSNLENTMS